MNRLSGSLLACAFVSLLAAPALRAEAPDVKQRSELVTALDTARVALDRGFAASAARGKPISGKYEIEDGKLQLSVYVAKGGQFYEVIVDHVTGKIGEVKPIHDGADLSAAKSQQEAMSKAKTSLQAAAAKAVRTNGQYRVVSVIPEMNNGHPCAEITMVKGEDWGTVTERLD
jgi:hypothetical protein